MLHFCIGTCNAEKFPRIALMGPIVNNAHLSTKEGSREHRWIHNRLPLINIDDVRAGFTHCSHKQIRLQQVAMVWHQAQVKLVVFPTWQTTANVWTQRNTDSKSSFLLPCSLLQDWSGLPSWVQPKPRMFIHNYQHQIVNRCEDLDPSLRNPSYRRHTLQGSCQWQLGPKMCVNGDLPSVSSAKTFIEPAYSLHVNHRSDWGCSVEMAVVGKT